MIFTKIITLLYVSENEHYQKCDISLLKVNQLKKMLITMD